MPAGGDGPLVGRPGDVQLLRPDRDHHRRDVVEVRQRCGPGAGRHAQVAQVAVIARQGNPGDTRLIAYVVRTVPDDAADLPVRLREFAAERLPAYMIPAAVVLLDRLPLTTSGKLDRAALPALDYAA